MNAFEATLFVEQKRDVLEEAVLSLNHPDLIAWRDEYGSALLEFAQAILKAEDTWNS